MPVVGPGLVLLVAAWYWGWWKGFLCYVAAFCITGYLADFQFRRSIHCWAKGQGLVELQEIPLTGFKSLYPTIWTFSDIKRFSGRDASGKTWEVVAAYNARLMGFVLSVELIRFRELETQGSQENSGTA